MADEARNYKARAVNKFMQAIPLIDAQNTTGVSSLGAKSLGGPYTVFSVMAYRASTGSSGGSTKPSYRLQGSVDGTIWHTIGAATRTITVRSSAASLGAVTSTAGIAYVRASINNFSTSSGSNADKVKATVKILPVS